MRLALALTIAATAACSSAPILVSAPMLAETSAATASGGGVIAASGSVDGDWEGRGVQSDDRSWPMRVHIGAMEHGLLAAVVYPDEGCSGEWTMHEVEPNLWEGDENIRSDPRHKCIASGSVTLRRLQDGTLEWTWEGIDPGSGADLSAHAVLSRGQSAQPEKARNR